MRRSIQNRTIKLPVELHEFLAMAAAQRRVPRRAILHEALTLLAEEELPPLDFERDKNNTETLLKSLASRGELDADQAVLLALLRYAFEHGFLDRRRRVGRKAA